MKCNLFSQIKNRPSHKSIGTSVYHEIERVLRCSQEAAFFMSDIDTEIPACNNMPAAIVLFVHVFFYLFCYLLFVWPVLHRVTYDVFGLKEDFRLHFWVVDLDTPFLCPFDILVIHFVLNYLLSKMAIIQPMSIRLFLSDNLLWH